MKTCLLLIFSFCFIASIFASNNVPDHLLLSSFPGRSGQIIIGSMEKPELESRSSIFIENNSNQYKAQDIEDSNVANLIAHLLSVNPPLNYGPVDRSAFPKTSLFERSSSNLLIVLDDITLDELNTNDLLNFNKGQEITVKPSYFSVDNLSYLETMLSAAPPSFHGIIGNNWISEGKIHEAFGSGLDSTQCTSIQDMIAINGEERSLVYSISGSSKLARALGTSESFKDYTFSNSDNSIFGWDHKQFKFVDLTSSKKSIDLDLSSGFSSFFTQDFIKSSSYQSESHSFSITLQQPFQNKAEFSFNLNKRSISTLFAEIQMISSISKLIQQKPQPSKFISMGISCLSLIRRDYGLDSIEFRVALYLLDNAFGLQQSTYSKAINSQVLFLKAPLIPDNYEKAIRILQSDSSLEDVVALQIQKSFPQIYLSEALSTQQIQSLVEQITMILHQHTSLSAYHLPIGDIDEFHFLKEQKSISSQFRDLRSDNSTSDDDGWTNEQVANFQVQLWMPIILIIIAFLASFVMCSLHWEGQGSGLYIETTHVQHDHLE